jgi:hypothetical protein
MAIITLNNNSLSSVTALPTGISGQNYPAFFADLSADQTAPSSFVGGKVEIDNEIFDTDSCYDPTTNYRFTPNAAGKYFVYGMVSCDTGGNSRLEGASAHIFKNGSKILASDMNFNDNEGRFATALVHGTVDMNGSTDYLELYGFIGYNAGTPVFDGANKRTSFGAYRIGA